MPNYGLMTGFSGHFAARRGGIQSAFNEP